MPDRLLTESEDSMLQMEMSAVTEGSSNGCLCQDESGNYWSSIGDFYFVIKKKKKERKKKEKKKKKKKASRATSLP